MSGNRNAIYRYSLISASLMLIILQATVLSIQADERFAEQALILLAPGTDVSSTVEAIHLAGGHITHVFPPAALIGEVPAEMPLPSGILTIHRQTVDKVMLATLTDETRPAAQVWNALLAPKTPSDAVHSLEDLEAELVGDALLAPSPREVRSFSSDPTPGYAETSEYFIGRVAVSIILPESDGSTEPSTEDWTKDERTLVLGEITSALDWWAAREPNANLTFVYDDGTASPVTIGYEPITHDIGEQGLWITKVMEKKGYTSSSYFDQIRQHNDALRQTYDTDWAFTIIVVDSSNDGDNRFSDGHFAYAYLGGPFTVMTYGNNGYGPHNMDAVAAHEIGHIFGALDQYYSARQPCTRRSGYLGVENQNSRYGACASDVDSIMRGQTWPYSSGDIDDYARGQIGWRDSDADGILDPVDTTLSMVNVEYVPGVDQPNVLSFTGSVRDEPYPSPFRRSTIINKVRQVRYRVAGGEWMDAQPADGAFDTHTEDFTFTTPPLPTGNLDVELHVADSAGNELIQLIATVPTVDPVDGILDTTLSRLTPSQRDEGTTQGDDPLQLRYRGQGDSATNFVAAVYYRIDDNPWQPVVAQDGAFDEPREGFAFSVDLAALSPGEHQVQAYSVDGQGNVETSPASDSFSVQRQAFSVFLPLVMAAP